ncbi:APC family permease [Mediterraneibacter faecis]|uniref:APC family permease n=1 Tax=Mediterraneibacter faecis TaxID=592978 RepID=UPI001EDE8997|nr:APC family permease [Mediterraneibacter faecis]MCG4532066.1 APC family permease [Mediterraneibacter faecis]
MDNKNKSKKLNTGDVIVVAFGAMIGWGWVVSSGGWIQQSGVIGTILAFLLGGIMIYFVGLVYAELTTALPENGGAKVFSQHAFGTIGSFICTWSIILSYIGVVCFEACSFPTIIQYIFPGFLKGYLYTVAGFDIYVTWLLVAIISCVLITYINIKGVKTAAILQKLLTIVIAAVGMVLIIDSLINGDSSNLEGQLFVGTGINKILGNVLSVAMVAPFFLFGFDVIPQAAEEINIPLKKLGKLIVFSIALAVAFYGMVVFAVGYGMNKIELVMSLHGSGLVTADAMAKLFHSEVMAKILILGGMCGIATSWNSFLIGGSRALESMASSYMIPHVFCKKHKKYQTPYLSLILIGILSIISLFFGRQMLTWISNCASFACCLTYCIVSLSFLRLRKKEANLPRPYKVKNYRFVGIMATMLSGFLCMMYLIPGTVCSMIDQELIITVLWTIVGIFFAIGCKVKYRDKFGKLG